MDRQPAHDPRLDETASVDFSAQSLNDHPPVVSIITGLDNVAAGGSCIVLDLAFAIEMIVSLVSGGGIWRWGLGALF